jgi:hypothetical protein
MNNQTYLFKDERVFLLSLLTETDPNGLAHYDLRRAEVDKEDLLDIARQLDPDLDAQAAKTPPFGGANWPSNWSGAETIGYLRHRLHAVRILSGDELEVPHAANLKYYPYRAGRSRFAVP